MTPDVPSSDVAMARFGERLRYWREQAGLTQTQLAARLRYDNTLISKLERGRRPVSLATAAEADKLLDAGGELTDLAMAMHGHRRQRRDTGSPPDPIGSRVIPFPGASPASVPIVTPAERGLWPDRPNYGLLCPLHDGRDCIDESWAAARDPWSTTVHAYLGRLAFSQKLVAESVLTPTVVGQVEHTLGGLMAQVGRSTQRGALLHIAATLAQTVGRMRANLGHHGAAMAWLCDGARWAAGAGNTAALSEILSTMAMIAVLEGDTRSATNYAEAAQRADRTRLWVVVQGGMWAARIAGRRGDRPGFERRCAAVRTTAARFTERDRVEAPWFVGAEGDAYLHGFLAAGLRDLAARNNDQAAARRGVESARTALANLPGRMHPSELLLTLRLADCQARAGDHDAAIATATPVIGEALAAGLAVIDRELDSLRGALLRVGKYPGA
ncbi:MAG TPA: helix-turn-helix transcriptional regulator [Actinokineospora sp.]|nr:helix-turn-helix transcriptional regulator [Actinokineospora sp.]